VRVIILRTEDCKPYPQQVAYEIFDRGFVHLFGEYPHVQFWIEVGNEPDICGLDPYAYRSGALDTIRQVKPRVDAYLRSVGAETTRVRWMLSLPVSFPHVQAVLAGGGLREAGYAAVAYHIYGHYNLYDAGMWDTYQWLLRETDWDIWITELGINDPGVGEVTKAREYVSFWRSLPDRVLGVAVWTISDDPAWKNYRLTPRMMDVFADRFPRKICSNGTRPSCILRVRFAPV
jgi:hypothetical protein